MVISEEERASGDGFVSGADDGEERSARRSSSGRGEDGDDKASVDVGT